MLKEMMLFIKYPYTAGVIATIWLGTATIMAINPDLPFVRMVMIDMFTSIILAYLGFRGKGEM